MQSRRDARVHTVQICGVCQRGEGPPDRLLPFKVVELVLDVNLFRRHDIV